MNAYFTTLAVTTALVSLLSLFSAEGTTKRYVELLLSVCLMLAVVSPLRGLVASLPGWQIPGEEAPSPEPSYSLLLQEAEEALCLALCGDLGLNPAQVSLKLQGDTDQGGTLTLTHATLTLSGQAREAAERAKDYLKHNIQNCDCEVTVLCTNK